MYRKCHINCRIFIRKRYKLELKKKMELYIHTYVRAYVCMYVETPQSANLEIDYTVS